MAKYHVIWKCILEWNFRMEVYSRVEFQSAMGVHSRVEYLRRTKIVPMYGLS